MISLVWNYLGHRLGIDPVEVPRPSTKVVGINSLPYFDSIKQLSGSKPVLVGNFPAAIFETVDCDGKRHAHRIYLAPEGAGKADLGVAPNGSEREPKKSAIRKPGDNIGGRAVIWGDPTKAKTHIICEGIETGAAIALALAAEIRSAGVAVLSCINAGGIEAFKPWPVVKQVIVAADRDEASPEGHPPRRRGELAARKFASVHRDEALISIALPGNLGEEIDWLDVLRRDGPDAVRSGILTAERFVATDEPTNGQKPQGKLDERDYAEIARLGALSPIAYDREREEAATRLGCRVSTLDDLVREVSADSVSSPGQGQRIELPELQPWDTSVDGVNLLNDLSSTIGSYVVVSSEQADAITLWCLHAHAHDAHDVSPLLVLKSAQKRSGKSRLATVVARLVPRPLFTSGITSAALFRIIQMLAPTLLFDEVDAAMKRNRETAEALRGIINSAFERSGARYITSVPIPGGGYEPCQFSTWAPLLLSGIGDLPDTVRDRSIEIEMVRKRREEAVRRLRRRDGEDLNILARKAARWVSDNLEKIGSATPSMPTGLSDRAADAYEPLFAIAQVAGGDWLDRAHRAALALSGEQLIEDDNVETQLLLDIRAAFTAEQIKSETLVALLVELEGRPWAEFGKSGKPITANGLARLLRKYKVRPGTIRLGPGPKDTAKGYKLAQFKDVFERYLPDAAGEAVTPSQVNKSGGFSHSQTVTPEPDVPDGKARKASNSAECDSVTDGSAPPDRREYADLPPEEETAL